MSLPVICSQSCPDTVEYSQPQVLDPDASEDAIPVVVGDKQDTGSISDEPGEPPTSAAKSEGRGFAVCMSPALPSIA